MIKMEVVGYLELYNSGELKKIAEAARFDQ